MGASRTLSTSAYKEYPYGLGTQSGTVNKGKSIIAGIGDGIGTQSGTVNKRKCLMIS